MYFKIHTDLLNAYTNIPENIVQISLLLLIGLMKRCDSDWLLSNTWSDTTPSGTLLDPTLTQSVSHTISIGCSLLPKQGVSSCLDLKYIPHWDNKFKLYYSVFSKLVCTYIMQVLYKLILHNRSVWPVILCCLSNEILRKWWTKNCLELILWEADLVGVNLMGVVFIDLVGMNPLPHYFLGCWHQLLWHQPGILLFSNDLF